MARTFKDIHEINDDGRYLSPAVPDISRKVIGDSMRSHTARYAKRTEKKWKAGAKEFHAKLSVGGSRTHTGLLRPANSDRKVTSDYDKAARSEVLAQARRRKFKDVNSVKEDLGKDIEAERKAAQERAANRLRVQRAKDKKPTEAKPRKTLN